ncbi:MAG: 4'-phosphopantetheinyl transferase superfamily protein [Candidatus Bathyarchaeota archaeon]|nr:4'-phosphopantetheinyl transferase superfamily protein [Candidatus Termiticorpusculum sp.]
MFEVVVLRVVPELAGFEYDFLLSFVSSKRRERLGRFCFFGDARNSLLGDVLARVLLCRVTGFSNGELEFGVNSYGKPFLVNDSGVHFNISHVGSFVVCVVCDVPVGVDVELVKPVDVRLVERFFVSDEQRYVLSSQDDAVRNARFFEVWTKKESRIKWVGGGLFESLSSFSVLDSLETLGVFYHCICNNGELIGYVCSSKKEVPTVRVIDTSLLLRYVRLLK